ncbi:unnamed protein product [Rotaria sp. Silwood1]|nr:unnamed protein product [Rotaria sp. Silwood1]CAF3452797.1 unnamed protein product [Rotaria sp. Silwood1]
MIEHILKFILLFFACREVNVGDVVLYGLTICLPLIQSDNLLKIPSISLCYYKLVSTLCEQHSECIFRLLNPDQYSIFLSTIKLGLDNYDNEICKMCLETIQNLTLYTIKQQKLNQTNEKTKYLEHFLDYLLQEIVITTTTLSDLFDTLSGTIYTLICAYPNQFYYTLGQMKQYDEHLSMIIDKLANDIGQKPDYNRKAKLSFTVKFESFVTNLRRIMKK